MSSEPTDPRASWHADLADKDKSAHVAMARSAATSEVGALERRLDALVAELDICRAAVQRRSLLLEEQARALAERDHYIRDLEEAAAAPVPTSTGRSLARRALARVAQAFPGRA